MAKEKENKVGIDMAKPLYELAKRIINVAESSNNLDEIADLLQQQRSLLDMQPPNRVMIAVILPIRKVEQSDLNDRYPRTLQDENGFEVKARGWKHEMELRALGYFNKQYAPPKLSIEE